MPHHASAAGLRLGVLCVLLASMAAPARAQAIPPPAEDSRVRVTAIDQDSGRQRRLVGTVVSTEPGSLVLRPDRSRRHVAVLWDDVRFLDESTGRISRTATVLTGMAVGGALGAAVGYLLGEDCSRPADGPFDPCFSEEVVAVFLGVVGAAGGAVGGVLSPRPDRWRPRAVPYRIGVLPRPGGPPALHLSVSY
jgi:hypothetical protein